MALRIRGLVSVFRQVRDALARGIPPEERDAFRDRVRETLRTVEETCDLYGTSPEELPGPSRNAYRYLAGIDLDDLPDPGGQGPPPPARISGAVAISADLGARLWRDRERLLADGAARAALRSELLAHVAAIESICEDTGSAPSALPPRSRNVYAWLRFLAAGGNLEAHAAALVRAGAGLSPGESVHLVHMRALWTSRRRGPRLEIRVNEGYLAAPEDVWAALRRLHHREEPREELVATARAFAETEAFRRVLREIDSLAAGGAEASGRHHDLGASFDRVNERLFGGRIRRPRLRWNRTPTARKFGHYRHSASEVMVSVTLDDPAVPARLVDFIVYHELLHLEQAERGERSGHDRAFREAERRFPGYGEVTAMLDRLARGEPPEG